MFTGLVEKKAAVVAVRRNASAVRLDIDLEELSGDAKPGDSIAVNGACLTISGINGTIASFDVVPESIRRTSLADLAPGSPVNIERALRVGDRLGGHFVQGHVDGTGTITGRTRRAGEYLLHITIEPELSAQMIEKGSVAVDGISLTITSLTQTEFTVAVIPHTLEHTTLRGKPDGSRVNIEVDMLGKYVKKLLGKQSGGGITEGFLREHGF